MKRACLTVAVGMLLVLGSAFWTACSDDDGHDNNNNNNVYEDAGIDAAPDEFAEVTILQTSDVHSHASGYGPFLDYTPDDTTDSDTVVGGYARLATLIGQIRSQQDAAGIPVVLVDSGDFTMGTMYDMAVTAPISFTFLQMMEYDAATLGNHEFDWGPAGAAMLINAARTGGFSVPLVASNTVTDATSSADDGLEALFSNGAIRDKLVLTLDNGLVVGILGLMGPTADAQAPGAAPVSFDHNYASIQGMVNDLVDNDNVDMVIVLSHGGIDSAGQGDDENLADNVDGIHIIASGHEHTASTEPTVVNGTYIFEPGEYGEFLARMDVNFNVTQSTIENATFTLLDVDDSVPGNATVQGVVDTVLSNLDTLLLAGLGVVAATPVVELPFDMERIDLTETPLGNVCADALRTVASAVVLPTVGATEDAVYHMSVIPDGVIRDGLYQGETGVASFMDVYNVLPLGASADQTQTLLGYPLITAYLTPAEIKRVGEVAVSLPDVLGWSSVWLNVGGIRFDYDPSGTVLNRITGARLCGNTLPATVGGDEDFFSMVCTTSLNLTDETTLYRVVGDLYAILSLGVVTQYGISIVPKKSNGTPINLLDMNDILSMRIDADPATGGVQELKPWLALYMFLRTLPDYDSSGLPEIPNAVYNPTNGVGMGRFNAQ